MKSLSGTECFSEDIDIPKFVTYIALCPTIFLSLVIVVIGLLRILQQRSLAKRGYQKVSSKRKSRKVSPTSTTSKPTKNVQQQTLSKQWRTIQRFVFYLLGIFSVVLRFSAIIMIHNSGVNSISSFIFGLSLAFTSIMGNIYAFSMYYLLPRRRPNHHDSFLKLSMVIVSFIVLSISPLAFIASPAIVASISVALLPISQYHSFVYMNYVVMNILRYEKFSDKDKLLKSGLVRIHRTLV